MLIAPQETFLIIINIENFSFFLIHYHSKRGKLSGSGSHFATSYNPISPIESISFRHFEHFTDFSQFRAYFQWEIGYFNKILLCKDWFYSQTVFSFYVETVVHYH